MILVTGASGLVGLHLIQYLSMQRLQIVALYKSAIPVLLPHTNEEYITWLACDLLDIGALASCFESITHVYHCAALVTYDKRLQQSMMETNVTGTANVVNFCLENKIKKLVFVSSISAIGKEAPQTLISEKTLWNTTDYEVSQYAISKHHAEMEVWRGIAEGLCAVIINPAVILGEGNINKSSTHLFKIVHDEFSYYTSGATAWVDVKDVVKAMVLLMGSEIQNERFIISAGNYTYKEIFDRMAHAMGKKAPHIYANTWLTELVWRISYIKSLLTGTTATITKETARNAHEINQYDNQKFLKAFPAFRYHDMGESIIRIANALFPKR